MYGLYVSNLLPRCPLNQLKQIHAVIIATSLCHNIHIFSKFLRRSTEFGSMDYSNLIFSKMGTPFYSHIMPWNIMLRGFAFNGPLQLCIYLFDELRQRGLKSDGYTYPHVLNSCSDLGLFRKAQNVHGQIIKSGFGSTLEVSNSLFNLYIKMQSLVEVRRGEPSDARKVFDNMPVKPVEVWNQMIYQCVGNGDVSAARELFDLMPEKDVITWNSMILGYTRVGELSRAGDLFKKMPEKSVVSWTSMIKAYADAGDVETARKLFEEMPCRNVVSWNSMMSSYTKLGKFQEALDLFERMQAEGILPDEYTFVSVLCACSHTGALELGKWIHYLIEDWPEPGVRLGTALINMYAKCGDINRAFTLFVKTRNKDVFCWNVMIKSLALHGRAEDAIQLFFLMPKIGLKPNEHTFTGALVACSHGGLVEQGRRIFYSMERDFGFSPKLEHFGCIVDLLSRNGKVEEAQDLVNEMPYKPDIAIWGALLGGCRVIGDLKLAEKVIERAIELESNESGVHVLLSNIHASVGQWHEALYAREKMEERKILKKVGSSTIV